MEVKHIYIYFNKIRNSWWNFEQLNTNRGEKIKILKDKISGKYKIDTYTLDGKIEYNIFIV